MRTPTKALLTLALLLCAGSAHAQDVQWKPSTVRIGQPQPLHAPPPTEGVIQRVSLLTPQPVYRGQAPGDPLVPPPPAFPGAGGGFIPPPPGVPVTGPTPFAGQTPYNCGQVNNNSDQGGFFTRAGDKLSRCWQDVTGGVGGAFAPTQNRSLFQSDHCLDEFASPVSNPFFSEDPRALTEVRPYFIWEHVRPSNATTGGADAYFVGAQGRLAITPWFTIVVSELGWTWLDAHNPAIAAHDGFSELHIGPKFTFIRNDVTKTAAAFGINFNIATGPSKVFQDTGTLSVVPYFSFAQNFGCTSYGSFNFMDTTGYSIATDSQRTDFFYSSFHLDFNVLNQNHWYPLVELNWFHYTQNGGARPFPFEGAGLFNFGSMFAAGHDDVSVALGVRYKWTECLQFGLAGEWGAMGGSNRHLEAFRVTADMIFRY